MKNKVFALILRILISLIISSLAGYFSSLLIPKIEPQASIFINGLIHNSIYQPVSLFILLSLIPMLVSFIIGFLVFTVLPINRQRSQA